MLRRASGFHTAGTLCEIGQKFSKMTLPALKLPREPVSGLLGITPAHSNNEDTSGQARIKKLLTDFP
jgi:hypothetical protein